MDVKIIERLAKKYRNAILDAYDNNGHVRRLLNDFPNGCCQEASILLGNYLSIYNISTKTVLAKNDDTSHAWLVLVDDVLEENIMHAQKPVDPDMEEYIKIATMCEYGVMNKPTESFLYNTSTLNDCIIVDITGNQAQFRSQERYYRYNRPVYVGYMDEFHKLFNVYDITDNILNEKSFIVYNIINDYLIKQQN